MQHGEVSKSGFPLTETYNLSFLHYRDNQNFNIGAGLTGIEVYIPDLYIYSLVAFFSLILIMKSAGYIISAIADYARKTGLSEFLIGSLVVAVGTSLPEWTTAVITSIHAKVYMIDNIPISTNTLSLGNVIGANIIDVTVVLGAMALLGKKIKVHGTSLDKVLLGIIGVALLPLLFGIDGHISRLEGGALILAFIGYVYLIFRREGKFGSLKRELKWSDIWQDMAVIALALIALLLSANWLVYSARHIAIIIGVSDFFIGLVLLAVGTTIPEFTVEITSVIRGTTGIAFGDIIGAVIINSTMVLGTAAVIFPLSFQPNKFITAALFMVTSVFIALLFIKKKEITWEEGLGLIMIYVTFLAMQTMPA